MKKNFRKFTALATAGFMTVTMAAPALAEELTKLEAPQNLVINYGTDPAASTDDTITFEGVENAASYKVYVFQEGDTSAYVTQGTGTTVDMPYPLDAGAYPVFVVAVGDGAAFDSSVASAQIEYTVEEKTATPLGQVTDIVMDFSKVDADNVVYPTISFAPVENAGRYLVDVYAADAQGNKQLTSLGYTTRLTVPGNQYSGYMMDSTNYNALIPGYYVVAVTAMSNNSDYANGEAAEQFVAWTGVEAIQPQVKAEVAENGGITVTLENNESYNPGITLGVQVYTDAACTQLVKETSLTYSTSTSFGQVNYNNTVALEVKDAREGDLVTGTEYFITMSFDQEIYTGNTASDPVAVTCDKAGDGKASTGGGFPGGGATGFEVEPEAASFDEGAETIKIKIGSHAFFDTTGTLTDSGNGAYTYTLAKGDPAAPFDCAMVLTLNADGTTKLTVEAAGPIGGANKTGTWTVDGGVVTLNWD